jgi:hypothetical protein
MRISRLCGELIAKSLDLALKFRDPVLGDLVCGLVRRWSAGRGGSIRAVAAVHATHHEDHHQRARQKEQQG